MLHTAFALLATVAAYAPSYQEDEREDQEVPVTIKELDLAEAMREFQAFQRKLGEFREEIGAGREIARETAGILEELRASAAPENDFNEGAILDAVGAYVDGVLQKQVELVDFLESQRYRITYYANKMASSVRAEDLALLFGTETQNEEAIGARVTELERARGAIADFIDALPPGEFDRATFRATSRMSGQTKQELDGLLYVYQQEKNALDFAKKRLELVRSAGRAVPGGATAPDVDADLLVGQMFGALDRIRLQMSLDFLYLERLLQGYSQSTRTQEILTAFQSLIELQGDIEGPSPELSSVLDWLQDSSARRISLGASRFSRPGLDVPRAPELLREAYEGARAQEE
jgi:hypothetical protein